MRWGASSAGPSLPTANSRPLTAPRATGMPVMPRSSYPARRLRSPARFAPATRSSIPRSNSLHGTAVEIMTGAPVPAGADHVVMFEHVHYDADSESIRLRDGRAEKHPPQPGENIVASRRRGPQRRYCALRRHAAVPAHIAAAAACGAATVHVYAPPRVSILASGDELVDLETAAAAPPDSQLQQLLAGRPGEQPRGAAPPSPARPGRSRATCSPRFGMAMDSDLLLLTGGVSVGKYDFAAEALLALGR